MNGCRSSTCGRKDDDVAGHDGLLRRQPTGRYAVPGTCLLERRERGNLFAPGLPGKQHMSRNTFVFKITQIETLLFSFFSHGRRRHFRPLRRFSPRSLGGSPLKGDSIQGCRHQQAYPSGVRRRCCRRRANCHHLGLRSKVGRCPQLPRPAGVDHTAVCGTVSLT